MRHEKDIPPSASVIKVTKTSEIFLLPASSNIKYSVSLLAVKSPDAFATFQTWSKYVSIIFIELYWMRNEIQFHSFNIVSFRNIRIGENVDIKYL